MPSNGRTKSRVALAPSGGTAAALAALAALAGLIVVAHARVVVGGLTWVERDALRFTRPSREFLVDALRAGRLPEWNDAVGFGAPFAANPVHEALAPLGWTMALLPTPWGFDLYNLVLLVIAALGTAAWSRSLGADARGVFFAGAALGLGGYAASMAPNGWLPAMAWIPWVGWGADRLAQAAPQARARACLPLSVFFACQLAAGEPAALSIAVGLAAWTLWARAVRLRAVAPWLAASVVSGSLLAAVSVIPAVALLPGSARAAGLDGGGLEWSLHPARLVELIWPMAFGAQPGDGWYAGLLLGSEAADPCWSFQLFLGAPVLLAALAGGRSRPVRRLLYCSVPFVLLAAGAYTPVYGWLLRALPPLRAVNFPEKFVFGALLAWCVAAGVGLGRLLDPTNGAADRAPRWRRVWASRGCWLAAGLLASAGLALLLAEGGAAELIAERARQRGLLLFPEVGLTAAVAGAWIAAAGSAAFAVAVAARGRPARWRSWLALAALVGPSLWVTWGATTLGPRATVAAPPQLFRDFSAAKLAADAPRPRLFRVDPPSGDGPFRDGAEVARAYHESVDTNIAARFGFQVLPGFVPGESARSRRFGRDVFPRMDKLDLVRLLGVDALAARDPEQLQIPFEVVTRGAAGWALLNAPGSRPRGFVTPDWREAPDDEAALAHLADPGRIASLPTVWVSAPAPPPPNAAPGAPGAAARCTVRVRRPEEVRLDCESAAGGLAVLLEAAAPGWTVEVDGTRAPLLLADGLFRAAAVPSGRREVVFRYRTPGLRAGMAISALAWLVLAAVCGTSLLRRRPHTSKAASQLG
jgi:hypothetical protein